MKALVTGASGFVGSYLVSRLVESGAQVLGIDSAAGGAGAHRFEIDGAVLPPYLPGSGAELARCDLLDAGAAYRAVAGYSPDVVFHLAAQSSAAKSFEDPAGTMRTNVMGTMNLLEAVRRSGRPRVVITGSAEEYGVRDPGEMPLGESSPVEPVSPYAASKAAQNMIAMQYHRAFGLDVVATRSFSHTGPGQSPVFVLPSFARQCAEIKAGLRGPSLRTGNIEVIRDFLDVRDVVEAYMLLAEKGKPGKTYNVCSGEGLALTDAVRAFTGMTGTEVRVERDQALYRPADVPVLTGDNTMLTADCGWSASISREKMLADLFAWCEASVSAAREESGG